MTRGGAEPETVGPSAGKEADARLARMERRARSVSMPRACVRDRVGSGRGRARPANGAPQVGPRRKTRRTPHPQDLRADLARASARRLRVRARYGAVEGPVGASGATS